MATQKSSHGAPASNEDKASLFNSEKDHSGQLQEDINQDSDGSFSPEEFITVNLAEVRKDVTCPICLGIIRKTKAVMECLHRFCGECIDKAMRIGNNECPACRTHCASRRSLRDDLNYDAMIAALFPDIDKYEAEELEFDEEEKACNEQIQASIAETLRRQSEAKRRKRATSGATAATFVRNQRATELQGSDNEHAADATIYPAELVTDALIHDAELTTDAPISPAELVVDAPIYPTEVAADASVSPVELVVEDDHDLL